MRYSVQYLFSGALRHPWNDTLIRSKYRDNHPSLIFLRDNLLWPPIWYIQGDAQVLLRRHRRLPCFPQLQLWVVSQPVQEHLNGAYRVCTVSEQERRERKAIIRQRIRGTNWNTVQYSTVQYTYLALLPIEYVVWFIGGERVGTCSSDTGTSNLSQKSCRCCSSCDAEGHDACSSMFRTGEASRGSAALLSLSQLSTINKKDELLQASMILVL